MKEYTIKNLFNYWLKTWPVTLALVLVGTLAGIFLLSKDSKEVVFSGSTNIIILNSSSLALPQDYPAIINDPSLLVSLSSAAGIDKDSCDISATSAAESNVVSLNSKCSTSAEDVEKLHEKLLKGNLLKDTLIGIYGENENIEIKQLSSDKVKTISSGPGRITTVVTATILGVVASMAIAFVRFDFASSKPKK